MNTDDLDIADLLVNGLLERGALPESAGHECPYLPDQTAVSQGLATEEMAPEVLGTFLERGFRRSGQVIYRPVCPDCNACVPLRIPVHGFRMSRSQKRVWQRNRDLRVEIDQPGFTDEKHELYARYLEYQHDGTMTGSQDEFTDFLCVSPADTVEFRYHLGNRLVGIGIADRCPGLLSSVYMYFDPEFARRSLGTYSLLWECRHALDCGLQYYYLGYYVAECSRMSYKAAFRPAEKRLETGGWVPSDL